MVGPLQFPTSSVSFEICEKNMSDWKCVIVGEEKEANVA